MAKFTGIFLPQEILSLEDLNLTEKVLLCQIIPLALERPCTALNRTFAGRLGLTETSISLNIKSLESKGYIEVDYKKSEGNKREISVYYEDDALFKILKDPSLKKINTPLSEFYTAFLKDLKTLFKSVKEPVSTFKGAAFKNLKPIINKTESTEESKPQSKEKNIEKDSAKKLRLWTEPFFSTLQETKDQTPPPKVAAAPPPQFGDGELQQLCRKFATDNKNKYPAQLYVDFLLYWTAPIQNGRKPDIGKEKWRIQETFQLASRLSTWFNKSPNQYQNHAKSQSAGLNTPKHLGATAVFSDDKDYSGGS